MSKIKVLNFAGKMDFVGVERTLTNYFRNIDREKIQFDFLVRDHEKGYYDDEIKMAGGKIFVVSSKHDNIISNMYETFCVLKRNSYDIIHIHCTTSTALIDAAIARCCGCKHVIVHSRTAGFRGKTKLIHLLLRPLLRCFATDYAACSKEAGIWLVGKKAFEEDKIHIIPNARDCLAFVYRPETREEIRKNLKFGTEIVVGHVGNFMWQKNHVYLIQVFAEFLKLYPTAQLLLIGYNPFQESAQVQDEVAEMVKLLGIEQHVAFLGKRTDVSEIMQAMDVFIFPSLVEGLPGVVVEAQSSGLPCIVSNTITPECKISELVQFLPLEQLPEVWAHTAAQTLSNFIRKDMTTQIQQSGYDIVSAAKRLEEYYNNLLLN